MQFPFRQRLGQLHVGAALLFLVSLACSQPQPASIASSPSDRDSALPPPVVLVHGWQGRASDFAGLVSQLVARGYPQDRIFGFEYATNTSNKEIASRLAAFLARVLSDTQSPAADLVGFSMGTLSSRYCIKTGACGSADSIPTSGPSKVGTPGVRKFLSIAGPNHGSELATVCARYDVGCEEMIPGSKFLEELNGDDETPGGIEYYSLWSRCDGLIYPPESALLEGATNIELPCIHHLQILGDRKALEQVVEALSSPERI